MDDRIERYGEDQIHAYSTLLLVLGSFVLGTLAFIVVSQAASNIFDVAIVPRFRDERTRVAGLLVTWGVFAALPFVVLKSSRFLNNLSDVLSRTDVAAVAWFAISSIGLYAFRIETVYLLTIFTSWILCFISYHAASTVVQRRIVLLAVLIVWCIVNSSTFPSSTAIPLFGVLAIAALICVVAERLPFDRRLVDVAAIMVLALHVAVEVVMSLYCLSMTILIVAAILAATIGRECETESTRHKVWWTLSVISTAALAQLLSLNISMIDLYHRAIGGISIAVWFMWFYRRYESPLIALSQRMTGNRSLEFAFVLLVVVVALNLNIFAVGIFAASIAIARRFTTKDTASHNNDAHSYSVTPILIMILGAIVVRILFVVVTDRVWEDTLITLRHAENAAAGRGLTHHPAHGLVHGFTSALSVIIPYMAEVVVSGSGLEFQRFMSLVAGGLTIYFAAQIGRHPQVRLRLPSFLFLLAYLAFDHSQISFGMAGMETQVWTAVLFASICCLVYRRDVLLGLTLALAAYSRPDAVVWIFVCLLAVFTDGNWRRMIYVASIAFVAFLPWLAFTTWYYGSPAPHTIIAKGAGYKHQIAIMLAPNGFVEHFVDECKRSAWFYAAIIPPRFQGDGVAITPTTPAAPLLAHLLVFLAALGSIQLARSRAWGIVFFLFGYYVACVLLMQIVFAWYIPPIVGVGAVLVACGINEIGNLVPNLKIFPSILSTVLIAAFVLPLPWTFATEARIQHYVENGVRRRIGEWLQANAEPGDYVTAECLGYFGYYSKLPFHDYPGLCSPRSVAALKKDGKEDRFLTPIVERLKPRWVVLRSIESGVDNNYVHVKTIELSEDELRKLNEWLPTRGHDTSFRIYRRRE